MKARVYDPRVLQSIGPSDFDAYLRASGWTDLEPIAGDRFTFWERVATNGETFEVLVPREQTWKDYSARIAEAVASLAKAEQRSELEVVQDLPLSRRDVVRLRFAGSSTTDGSIPLPEGVQLVRSAKGMMTAAACSALEPKRSYRGRKADSVSKYVDNLKLGQTEHGSYVLTVHSPTPSPSEAENTQTAFEFFDASETEHFSRRVTRQLASGLQAVVEAASKKLATGDMSMFEAGVARGISADLCDALSLYDTKIGQFSIEVGLRWAPANPVDDNSPTAWSFNPEMLQIISDAGRLLRENEPFVDFEVIGPVIEMTRPGGDLAGHIIIHTVVEGNFKKVRLNVFGEQWNIANDAMTQNRVLSCVGELKRDGSSWRLDNPREFQILED